MSQNKTLDIKILLYAYRHKGDQRDLLKLSRQLKIRLSEGFLRSLRNLEEEKFLVADPQIWRLTVKGETTASVIETSQKNYLHLLLLCVALCVAIILTIVVKNFL